MGSTRGFNKVRVLQLWKNAPDTHPQLGCTLPYTSITLEFYPDALCEIGYGVYTGRQKYREGITRAQAMKMAREVFTKDGYSVKEASSKKLEDALAADEMMDAIYATDRE